jgi:hypothetical protein
MAQETTGNENQTGGDMVELERRFIELRDRFLGLSHEYAKSEGRHWDKAEELFLLSKKVDHLRGEMLNVFSASGKGSFAVDAVRDRNDGVPPSTACTPQRRKSKKEYPKYAVRSGVLIKTGLSRDRRSEYEHAVQKSEFDKIIARLNELSSRKHFAAEDVLGKVNCPGYQAYLVISLLKERGVLIVPRRGFYVFRQPKKFTAESASIWDAIARD